MQPCMAEIRYKDSDINEWPDRWKGVQEDTVYGERILELFKPFIETLKLSGRSRKTINNHIDNLWMLGGWLIKHINYHPEDRIIEPLFVIPQYVDGYNGPLIHDFSESQQRSFDGTCRIFYGWLVPNHLENAWKRPILTIAPINNSPRNKTIKKAVK
jgi:hypothetical protein